MGQTTEELHIAVRQVDGRDGFGDQTQIANGRDEARDRPALRSLNDGHSPHRHGEELEPRRIEWIRICDVRPDPLNAKLHHLGEIVTSIKKRGFVELPAVDERTGKLVAGHGRIEALAALKKDGGELPKGLKLADDGEWLVPVLHGWASKDDTDAKAYLVASNRLVEVGGWDDAALESLLVSIAKEGGAEALLGYRVRWRRRRQDTVGPGEGAVRGETPRRCLPGACRGLW